MGVPMLREDFMRIALRYDTAMSRALLRALGIDVPRRLRRGSIVLADRYSGAEQLMAQRHGVDLRT